MPDDEEFSIQQLRVAVAGCPELICFTADGYALFSDRERTAKQLPLNQVATCLWRESSPESCVAILGRAFLAHPHHIPAYWKSRWQNDMRLRKLRGLLQPSTA